MSFPHDWYTTHPLNSSTLQWNIDNPGSTHRAAGFTKGIQAVHTKDEKTFTNQEHPKVQSISMLLISMHFDACKQHMIQTCLNSFYHPSTCIHDFVRKQKSCCAARVSFKTASSLSNSSPIHLQYIHLCVCVAASHKGALSKTLPWYKQKKHFSPSSRISLGNTNK